MNKYLLGLDDMNKKLDYLFLNIATKNDIK
jgi:hypothetical protein